MLVVWKKKPYTKGQAGTIYPLTTMATVTFDDGKEGTLAWLPKSLELVVDISDRKATYKLDIMALVGALEEALKKEDGGR